MNNNVESKTVFIDLIGQTFDSKQEAENSNHNIHLKFRKYIEEELFVCFKDGDLDKLSTTKYLWDNLEFTPECIKKIYHIMIKDED